MKQFIKSLFFILTVLLLSISVMAGNKAGFAKIVGIEGEVGIKRRGGDKTFKAVVGMKLVEGDSIYTDKNSNVTVVFDNNNQITVGIDSVVNLAEMRKLSTNERKTTVSVKKGSVFSNIKKKLTEKEIYQIKTPNAVAGVRGTKFYVHVNGTDSFVHVLEGKVRLESAIGKKGIDVKRGALAKAEKSLKPFLIKNMDKEPVVEDIKNDFILRTEQKYNYEARGNQEKLYVNGEHNAYTSSVNFDPEDPSGSDTGGNTYTVPSRRITVLYSNILPSYKLNVNSVNMSSNNPSIRIDYDGVLVISGEIVPLPGTAFISDTFTGKSLYLLHGGIPAARLIPLNVTNSGNKFSNIISTSDFDLSNENSFEFWIN